MFLFVNCVSCTISFTIVTLCMPFYILIDLVKGTLSLFYINSCYFVKGKTILFLR